MNSPIGDSRLFVIEIMPFEILGNLVLLSPSDTLNDQSPINDSSSGIDMVVEIIDVARFLMEMSGNADVAISMDTCSSK